MLFKKMKFLIPTTLAGFLPLLGSAFYSSMSAKEIDTGLTLFYQQHSFYARKVMLTLEEKKLPYTRRKVQIVKNEQYEPWFIAMNPRGEIPVLKDGNEIIVDSKKIIDYLENNFTYGFHRSLTSKEIDGECVAELRRQIDAVEGNLIGFGLLFFPEYTTSSDKHYPYNLPGTGYALKKQITNMANSLRNMVETYPECKEVLLNKADHAQKTYEVASSKSLFDKEVGALQALFAAMENQLASHPTGKEKMWLCSESFSQADVSLAILMDRIWRNGAADFFWSHHPYLKRYFGQVQDRDSYKAIEPIFWEDLDVYGPIIGIAAAVIAFIVAAAVSIPLLIARFKRR